MRFARGEAKVAHLVVELEPLAGEHVFARDDDVDLGRAVAHRGFDLLELELVRNQPGRKARGHRRHRNADARERIHGRGHEAVIDADRTGVQRAVRKAQRGQQVGAHGRHGLGAQPAHALGRVVAVECGQVDAGDGLEQPAGLRIFLDRAAAGQRGHAAFGGREVDADVVEPAGVERLRGVARDGVRLVVGHRRSGTGDSSRGRCGRDGRYGARAHRAAGANEGSGGHGVKGAGARRRRMSGRQARGMSLSPIVVHAVVRGRRRIGVNVI